MVHRLNTNKYFMIGNGILAVAVIFVVIIFFYISMPINKDDEEKQYIETFTVNLVRGFEGDSISIYINDSLLVNKVIAETPETFVLDQFADENALMIVDNKTDKLSIFNMIPGGVISLAKDEEGIKELK